MIKERVINLFFCWYGSTFSISTQTEGLTEVLITFSRKCFLPVRAGAESHTWLRFCCECKCTEAWMHPSVSQVICWNIFNIMPVSFYKVSCAIQKSCSLTWFYTEWASVQFPSLLVLINILSASYWVIDRFTVCNKWCFFSQILFFLRSLKCHLQCGNRATTKYFYCPASLYINLFVDLGKKSWHIPAVYLFSAE